MIFSINMVEYNKFEESDNSTTYQLSSIDSSPRKLLLVILILVWNHQLQELFMFLKLVVIQMTVQQKTKH